MKKTFILLLLNLSFLSSNVVFSQNKSAELDQLFKQLKKADNLPTALKIENKIWERWSNNSNEKIFADSLAIGVKLMNNGEFVKAYNIFSSILQKEPEWAECWNKRATVLYLMKKYKSSLKDIEKVLKLEPRHFGALSGQGLVYIKLGEYEKAIESYKEAQKIYPIIDSAKKMIPQLIELIKNEAI